METRKLERKAKAEEIFRIIKAKVDVPKLMRKVDDELWAPEKNRTRKRGEIKKKQPKIDFSKLIGTISTGKGANATRDLDDVIYEGIKEEMQARKA